MKFPFVLRRSILVGFGFALIVLILIDLTAYFSSIEYTRSVAEVKRTYRILNALKRVQVALVSAESEVRGYSITADDRYMELYEGSVGEVNNGLVEMNGLVVDPASLGYLIEFEELSTARMARLTLTLEAMREGGIEAVRKVAGPGKELMDAFRVSSSKIEARQLQLLDDRDRTAHSLSRRSIAVVLVGSTLAVGLLFFSMILLGQQLARRERLENEVLEISEREQRRIGQDLHDGVCQQLTGISLLSRSLNQKLKDPLAADAAQITLLINQCIEMTRQVTRGLHPVPDEPSGLMLALKELSERIGAVSRLDCRFVCPEPVAIPDAIAATNLFRIAQEATQNALRHAAPRTIEIALSGDETCYRLTVSDDGCGLAKDPGSDGMGLEIMAYRARSIGGSLEIRPAPGGGTVVTCTLPLASLP